MARVPHALSDPNKHALFDESLQGARGVRTAHSSGVHKRLRCHAPVSSCDFNGRLLCFGEPSEIIMRRRRNFRANGLTALARARKVEVDNRRGSRLLEAERHARAIANVFLARRQNRIGICGSLR